MNNEFLSIVGFDFYTKDEFFPKEVCLRSGEEAIVWVHERTGHGILDPKYWVSAEYYKDEYRSDYSALSSGDFISPSEHKKIYSSLNQRQFNQFSDLINNTTKYLEVGCSFGGVLGHVYANKPKICHAVEPNELDASFILEQMPDVHIYNTDFLNAKIESDFYDVIASFEVLEHVISPFSFLKNAYNVLKKSGVIHFEVPNHNDVMIKYFNNSNYNNFYYHRAHIHYFTPESLLELAKHVGFEGEVIGFQMYPFSNNVHWLINKGPQSSAEIALSQPLPHRADSEDQIGKKVNNFFENIYSQYNDFVSNEMITDCLVLRAVKN